MKKTFLFFAALGMSLMASATTYEVSATTPESSDNIRRAIRDNAAAGDTILLVDAAYTENDEIATGKNIVLLAKEGVHPVITLGDPLKITGAGFTAKGITFSGARVRIYTGASGDVTFENCEFTNSDYGFFDDKPENHMGAITINNCVFSHLTKYAIYTSGGSITPGPADSFTITNCTFFDVATSEGYGIIIHDHDDDVATPGPVTIIDHCTFYNVATADETPVKVHKMGPEASFTNNVVAFSTDYSASKYFFYAYAGAVANHCVYFNAKHAATATETNNTVADPLFVNPATGDFNFTAESPLVGAAADGSNIGDPRWGVAQAQMTFTFLAPAANVEAMNNYTVQFAAVNPYDAATLTLQSSADAKANWDTIYSAAYTDQNAFDWAIRALTPGTYYLRAILAATEKTVIDTCAYTVTIVKDTQAPRAVADLAGSYESETMTLSWTDPTRDIPFGIPFDNANAVSASTKESEATATVAEEGDAVKVDFEVNTAWEYTGAKFACNLNNMTGALTFSLKSEATATMQVMVEQNGYDWWYADVDLDKSDFTPVTINFADWKKITWHTKSTADAFDGNNVTAIYIWVTYNPSASGTFYIKDVEFAGAIPASEHFEKTILVRADNEADATLENGTVIYEGAAETCVDDVDFVSTQTYYYAAFAVDDLGNAAEAATYKYEGGQTTSLNQLQQIDHVAKFFHNGRLMMLKNGKMYDVLGASVNQ